MRVFQAPCPAFISHFIFYFNSSVPVRSKLAIPATASFQITLNNLAAVGSPLCAPLHPFRDQPRFIFKCYFPCYANPLADM
jgi:hypothetical protein